MTAEDDTSPLCDLLVASFIDVEHLRGRTLEQLTGRRLLETPTSMIARVAAAWGTPFEALTCEQLRLLVSQGVGLEWTGPMACDLAFAVPCAEVSFYPGDLARAVLSEFAAVFASSPTKARAFLFGDFSWISGLQRLDTTHGGTAAVEAQRLLAEARAIADWKAP